MGENSGENSSIVRAFEGAKIDNDVFEVDDKEVLMKRMISEHPLFELLIETHINCLKVFLVIIFLFVRFSLLCSIYSYKRA